MIHPTSQDIGRRVIYRPPAAMPEEGIITSFNEKFVFIRFAGDVHSKATLPLALEWATPRLADGERTP